MIEVDNVAKRYATIRGPGPWVLQDVSFVIKQGVNVGLIGRNGAGKSTLLRLIGGIDFPTKGEIRRHCRVSWPMGLAGGLQGSMTGRQNARFVIRIHGEDARMDEMIDHILEFSELGHYFDEPIKSYSSGMRARLVFALSMSFNFDVYISDEMTAVGDISFRSKAKKAFEDLADSAGLIMASHQARTLRDFCQSGVLLSEGRTYWFDDIKDALKEYNARMK